jgi:opacity protein-like surface antigen
VKKGPADGEVNEFNGGSFFDRVHGQEKRRMRKTLVLAILAILVAATGTASAEWKAHSFEVGLYVPYVSFDSDLPLDNDFGYGVRFGYKFVKGHEVEIGWNTIATEFDAGPFGSFDVDFSTLNLGYLYNWTKVKGCTPFVTGGLGSSKFDFDQGGSETDSMYYVGGGVRFYFTNNFNLRLEGDYQTVDGDNDTAGNWIGAVGVGWSFGGK